MTENEDVDDGFFTKLMLGTFTAVLATALGTVTVLSYNKGHHDTEPVNVRYVGDLNRDGEKDILIQQRNGRYVPMYAVKEGDNIGYFSGDVMLKRNLESTTDYNKIERTVNGEEGRRK